MRGLIAAILLLASLAASAAPVMRIEVVSLKYRTVDDVLPVIMPLLIPEGKVTGANNQLIIRSTPDNLRELLPVIRHLDAPARQLILYVEQGETHAQSSREATLDAAIGGKNRVEIGHPERQNSVVARIGAGSGSGQNSSSQRIQTLDGRAAQIRTGKLIPVVGATLDAYGRPVPQIQHQSADHGIWVTPRLVGEDEVELEISTRHDDEDLQAGRIQTRRAESVVRGRIGEWLDLGGVGNQDSGEELAISGARQHSTHRDFSLRVRVELLD